MPLAALSPALRALYDEVDAILSQPMPELPGRVVRPITPEAAYAWEQAHRGTWIDDVETHIRGFAATPDLASDDEVRMAAALRGLALAELHWRESVLERVHAWRVRRWIRDRRGGDTSDPAIERAIEAAQQRSSTLAAAASDAFRSCARGAALHEVSSWWALCREQLGGSPFVRPDGGEDSVAAPCAVARHVDLRAPFHGASAVHVVVDDDDVLTPDLESSLRELAVVRLRAEGFDVASTTETDQTAARAVSGCAHPMTLGSWRHTSLVATVGLSCESDPSRDTCWLELSASPRVWRSGVAAAPISRRTLRSAMSRLREGRSVGDGGPMWSHWWGLSGEPELALVQALSTEHQRVFAESIDHAAVAATRGAFERCVLDDGVRRARLDICVDVAPDGSVSSAVVATDPYASRPLDRAAARAYRSAAGRREPTAFHRCLLDAAMSVRFPCITATTRVGSSIDLTARVPPTTPERSPDAESE